MILPSLDKVNKLISELDIDQKSSEQMYKKYKRIHKTLYFLTFALNSFSLALTSSVISTLMTGLGSGLALGLGCASLVISGLGMTVHNIDQKISKDLKKHCRLLTMAQVLKMDLEQHVLLLKDNGFSEEDINTIFKSMEDYYRQKEKLCSNGPVEMTLFHNN